MKKVICFLFLILFSINTAKADVCAFVEHNVAISAVEILKKQSSIMNYCDTCDSSAPDFEKIKNVEYKSVAKNLFQVFVNDAPKDLAYIYLKKSDKYENLGFIANCDSVKDNPYHKFERYYNPKTDKKNSILSFEQEILSCENNDKTNTSNYIALTDFGYKVSECYLDIGDKIFTSFYAESNDNLKAKWKSYVQNQIDLNFAIYNLKDSCSPDCGTEQQFMAIQKANDNIKATLQLILKGLE